MGVNSLPKTVTRQRRDCDLNPGPSVPESSTLTTRLQSPRSCLNTCRLFQRDCSQRNARVQLRAVRTFRLVCAC